MEEIAEVNARKYRDWRTADEKRKGGGERVIDKGRWKKEETRQEII